MRDSRKGSEVAEAPFEQSRNGNFLSEVSLFEVYLEISKSSHFLFPFSPKQRSRTISQQVLI